MIDLHSFAQPGCLRKQGSDRTWKVGLVAADSLAGPWRRLNGINPAEYIETPEGIEQAPLHSLLPLSKLRWEGCARASADGCFCVRNPIVTRTTDKKHYVAVFDALMPDQIKGSDDVVGISVSADGVHFGKAQYLRLNATAAGCGSPVRTPQGLVPEPERCAGCYSMLYTGHASSGPSKGFANECWVMLRNLAEA